MLIPFEKMPKHARIWVYQTDIQLTEYVEQEIEGVLNEQIGNWAAHGAPLAGAFQILYNRFIIIAVDETINGTSGCSIDASTNWLKEIGARLGINFFDRSIAYLFDNEIDTVDFLKIKTSIEAGKILAETFVFNNMVNTIEEFNQNWKAAAETTWLKKYFTKIVA